MAILPYVLLAVYLLAVNFYALQLVRTLKRKTAGRGADPKAGNGKLFLAGLLGGAIGAYVTMLVTRYKTDSLLPMLALPLLAVCNVYLVWTLLRSGMLVIA